MYERLSTSCAYVWRPYVAGRIWSQATPIQRFDASTKNIIIRSDKLTDLIKMIDNET